MSMALNRESYLLHKLHSITGVIPVGFYMVQHLTLNSFTLDSPEKFNGVIEFFEGLPKHLLLTLEILAIWLPLAFHAIYGFFIVSRAKPNYFTKKYKWSENAMYYWQRVSGMLAFAFLIYHIITTTINKYINGADVIKYAAWQDKLTANGYLLLIVYMIGVLACSYHLAYGIWNFCIRWGITVREEAQEKVQKFSAVLFIAITLLGWGALFGFLMHKEPTSSDSIAQISRSA